MRPAQQGTRPLFFRPLSQDLPPSFLLRVPRELGIIDGSLKSLLLQTAYSVFQSPASPRTGSHPACSCAHLLGDRGLRTQGTTWRGQTTCSAGTAAIPCLVSGHASVNRGCVLAGVPGIFMLVPKTQAPSGYHSHAWNVSFVPGSETC